MQALIQCVSKVIGWKLILPKVVTSGCRLIVYWFLWGDVIIGFTGFMFHFVSIIEFMTCFYEFTECESMNFSVEKTTNFLLVKKVIFSLSFEHLRIYVLRLLNFGIDFFFNISLHILFRWMLFFLPNFQGPTFLSCPTSIPDSRVSKQIRHSILHKKFVDSYSYSENS